VRVQHRLIRFVAHPRVHPGRVDHSVNEDIALGNILFVFSLQIQLPWNSGLLLPGGRFISNMFSVLTSR
jgi:hypothetical protein